MKVMLKKVLFDIEAGAEQPFPTCQFVFLEQ
jgi:hypothetical protein